MEANTQTNPPAHESSVQHALKSAEDGLKHVVHALIAGLKAHPELLAELANMLVTRKVDPRELEKIGAQVAVSGAVADLQNAQ